jgi:hypothetical protein
MQGAINARCHADSCSWYKTTDCPRGVHLQLKLITHQGSEQVAEDLDMAPSRHLMQRAVALAVRGQHGAACSDELRHHLQVAGARRLVERHSSILVRNGHIHPVAGDTTQGGSLA